MVHKVLTGIGRDAFVVSFFVSGIPTVIVFSIGVVASGINAGLYLYDASETETEEELCDSVENFGWSLLSIGSGGSAQKIGVYIRSKWKGIIDLAVNIYGYFKP